MVLQRNKVVRWHLITGGYPPNPGGVSDYTRLVARSLADSGEEVHVWAPVCSQESPRDAGVQVHRLPGHFGFLALEQLSRHLEQQPKPIRLLVQYVPHLYGWKAMNVPFCLWLSRQRRYKPWVMFHEVAFPISRQQKFRHNLLGHVTEFMAKTIARAANQIFVAIPSWETKIRELAPETKEITWLPIPSNIQTEVDASEVAQTRTALLGNQHNSIIGHFGTYGTLISKMLSELLPRLLAEDKRRLALLLGRNGMQFAKQLGQRHPEFADQLSAPGELSSEKVATHLKACDLLIQPYPDGGTARRGSAMAGLALGMPIVTNQGHLTESIWKNGLVALSPKPETEPMVVLAEQLLRDPQGRARIAEQARSGYRERFSTENTIRILRTTDRNTRDQR